MDLKQNVYRETFQNIEVIQAKISTEQRNREQLLENLKNAEIESTEIKQKIRLVGNVLMIDMVRMFQKIW